MSVPEIQLKNVGIELGGNAIHHDISLTIGAGEGVVILGPSGTGKTLILKMIVGLLTPTSGEVWIGEHCMSSATEKERVPLRRNIGMLFQGAALFDSLTVFENIAYPLRESDEYEEEEIEEIVHTKLRLVGLPNVAQKVPAELSGGQKKRIGLARALASSPGIVLFDEPTTGLDPTATRMIDDLIVQLRVEYGITTISVTHDIGSAERISDRWLLIHEGKVAADVLHREEGGRSALLSDFVEGRWAGEQAVG